jgi:N-acetylglutamate synthase-like GNAT family acetyltransferase
MQDVTLTGAITVRPARRADVQQIEILLHAEDLDRSALILADFMVAEDAKGNFAGCARLKLSHDCVELSSVAVRPTYRGQGVGSMVITALLQRRDVQVIHLVCEPKEVPFFARFGFCVLPREDVPPLLIPKLLAYEAKVGTMVAMKRAREIQVSRS